MHPGQKMFYDFFIERAKDDKKEAAKKLLEDCFAKQAAGTFDHKYFAEVMPAFYDMVKPEAIGELKAAMENFASRL